MKRRNMMTAFMCAVCLAAAPISVFAEEAEETVDEVVEETEETTDETVTEEAVEETENIEVPERPDYVALDYVTLGDYKNIVVNAEVSEVTDDMVETKTESLIDQLGVIETSTEGTVQEGDIANIDYEGKKDGVAFDGGTAAGYDLTIGSGQFIDGFEDGLIGVEIGSTVDLELTFPENYHSADLAGQAVVFTVTVNNVQRMPEITDELIKEASEGEYADLEALKEHARTLLEEEAQKNFENEILENALEQICTVSTAEEYPQELKEYAIADTKNYYLEMAAWYGMELADFLTNYFGVTEDVFNEQIDSAVEESLLKELCIKGIAETEGIEITDEEYAEGCEYYAAQYGYTNIDEFLDYVGGENVVKISLLIEEVYDHLLENVTVEALEEETAEEETTAEEISVEETKEESAENTEE